MPQIDANGLSHHVIVEGDGPAVLLLHGFPDTAEMWRAQISALGDAGFRTIAPDLRGRGNTEQPAWVEDYALPNIVQDVVAIMDALGVERAHVVGHDWGAVVAWSLAAYLPERVSSLVALSVGHPGAVTRPTIEALQKGWYRLLFLSDSAETVLQQDDWYLMRTLLDGQSNFERHRTTLSAPGALSAGLNWYRANLPIERLSGGRSALPAVRADTLGVFGAHDRYLAEDGMSRSETQVRGSWQYERFDDAGHWLQTDESERFNRLLLEFLAARH